ncbi:MAG: hypothetical protein KAV82_10100 [Phycisphaerae bacterium]|nr:hypothetical protein [Phycisphaerae bacterium]
MSEFDLFSVHRRALMIVVGTYSVIRLIQSIWRWRIGGLAAGRHETLLRRWVELSLLRVRIRRFVFDVLQIVLLAAILIYLLWLHVG